MVRCTRPGLPLSGPALALGGGVSELQLSPLGTPDVALVAKSLWLFAQLGLTWTRVWPGSSDTALCSGGSWIEELRWETATDRSTFVTRCLCLLPFSALLGWGL